MFVIRRSEQRFPQRALAPGREGQQIVVVEIEQRAFEHRCKRQIVFGQGQKIAERDQILDGNLVGQRDAVGARDRNAAGLQRGDHRHCEGIALAHQDQDVAGADGPPGRGQVFLVAEPAFDIGGDSLREPVGGRALGASSSGDQGSAARLRHGFRAATFRRARRARSGWRCGEWRLPLRVSPGVRAASANTSSTASSTGCTVRNDRLSGTACQRAALCFAASANACPMASNCSGAAPWNE